MKRFTAIILAALLLMLAGCEKTPAPNTTSSTDESPVTEPVINIVSVTDQPLSAIITAESDPFAYNYEGYDMWLYKPYFDDKGGSYYYVARERGDATSYFLHYDNGDGAPVDLGLPSSEFFAVAAIIDDAIYGVKTIWADGQQHLQKYQNGKMELLLETPVNGCYFAQDGIYYQIEDKVYIMDYDGSNSKLITVIPYEMYYESALTGMIVYKGKLWGWYNDYSWMYDYPLWCYDFGNTFTMFDMAIDSNSIQAVNNGFIYYTTEGDDYNTMLYRLNCETFCTELVSDNDVGGIAFYNDSILYTFERDLYRLDNQNTKKNSFIHQLQSL